LTVGAADLPGIRYNTIEEFNVDYSKAGYTA